MFRKILAVFLLIIFAAALPPVIIVYNVKAVILDAEKIKKAAKENNVYGAITDYFNASIKKSAEERKEDENDLKLGIDVKSVLKTFSAPPEWVQKSMENLIDEFIGVVSGKKDVFRGIISFKELREKNPMFGKVGETSVIPDEIGIFDIVKNPSVEDQKSPAENLALIRDIVQKVILGAYIAISVLFAILVFIVFLAVRSLKSLFRWVGFALFLPGFFLFTGSLAAKLIFFQNKRGVLSNQEPISDKASLDLVLSLRGALFDLIVEIIKKNMLFSGIMLGAGLLLIILSFFFNKKAAEAIEAREKKENIAPSVGTAPTTIIENKNF